MKALHYFGQVYGWSKSDFLELTPEEANFLTNIEGDRMKRQEAKKRLR